MRHILRYEHPAEEWHNALPIGNGRLGAMIYGKTDHEIISLNEDSIWSGSFRKRDNPKALGALETIREAIRNGETEKASALCEDSFYGTNEQQRHYMPLGDLHIYTDTGETSSYEHTLDLQNGIDRVSFVTEKGVGIKRESFASCPRDVIVIRLTASRQGELNFTALIDGRDDYYDENCAYDENTLLFTVSDCIPYTCAITAAGDGCRTDANRIVCENGTEALIIIGCRTAYRTGDHKNAAVSDVKKAARMKYESLLSEHTADHRALFDRCELSLGYEDKGLATDGMLNALKDGDVSFLAPLAELYFDFSRYLMIAGSREGTLPMNLQGIWNKDMWPAWGCKYTININTEMNYWGAEVQNLSECHTPLFDHIERMREHGRVTAREMYGCKGAVCHHNTDIWGDTAPQDKWLPATLWPMGLAWLCTHIWEHYRFTGDRGFLAEHFDSMLEASEFFLDFLTENSRGELVTNPSLSPENTYRTAGGAVGTLAEGPSMDSQILHTLFGAVIEAADLLDISDEQRQTVGQIKRVKERIPAPSIGKYGQIMEWAVDYDEVEIGHRHISQLYGLYPGELIKHDDKRLSGAARATLERRLSHGGGHTGWSRAWIINMWARLHDGEKTEENISALLTHSTADSLLDMHPPFQIDGNFGGGAGIAESLFQSAGEVMEFLPALPPSFSEGSFLGLRARGGFEVSLKWQDSRPVKAVVTSLCGNALNIRHNGPLVVNGSEYIPDNGVISLPTEKGEAYEIRFSSER